MPLLYKIVAGLDIGPRHIFVTVARRQDEGWAISQMAVADSPKEAVSDSGVVVNVPAVAEVIRKLFARENIAAKDVILGCQGPGVLLNLHEAPSTAEGQIKEAVRNRLSKFFIFAGAQITSSYQVLESSSQGGSRKLKLLIAAAKNDIIDSLVQAVQGAGLNLIGIDENSLAVTRVIFDKVVKDSAASAVILTFIGERRTTMSIYCRGQLFYLHVMEKGIRNEDDVEDFLEAFRGDVGSLIQYYQSQKASDEKIQKIILCGQVELLRKLKEGFIENMDFNGARAEFPILFSQIKFDSESAKAVFDANPYGTMPSMGLAMKGVKAGVFPLAIDLLPREVTWANDIRRRSKRLSLFPAVLLMVCFVLLWIVTSGIRMTKADIERSRAEFDRTTASYKYLITLERERSKYQQESGIQEKIIQDVQWKAWDEALADIRRIIPVDARLTSFVALKDNHVSLSGQALSQESVFNFEKALKESPYFDSVQLGGVEARSSATGLISFSLACRLAPKED